MDFNMAEHNSFQEEFNIVLDDLKFNIRQSLNFDGYSSLVKTEEEIQARRLQILHTIEDITLQIVQCISENGIPSFYIRNQRDWNNIVFEDKIKMKPVGAAQTSEIRFSIRRSRSKFALIVQLLSKIHFLITTEDSSTRRELYYQLTNTVKSQSMIDSAIRDICCLLEVPPWEMRIFATSKGLVAGSLIIVTADDQEIDCNTHNGGILIPQDVIGIKSFVSLAKFILVVEKDAIFQKLLEEGFLDRLNPVILITAKGFPDINTRLLIRRLWDTLGIPVFVLSDADPHGIEIMFVYRYGSLSLSHQSEMLAVPAVRWLGVHPSDILALSLQSSALTESDKNKIKFLNTRPYVMENQKLKDEIKILLERQHKAEIEGMSHFAACYLTDCYIPNKIANADFV